MRSRRIIEESFKSIVVQSGNDHIKVELELLMDIRELLQQLNDRQLLEEVRKAREEIEDRRESLLTAEKKPL
ncbi:MAG: hypothetical protein WC479_02880 [Candidatus Izemoplasmatales bacterium]